jgi:hypothetical protein
VPARGETPKNHAFLGWNEKCLLVTGASRLQDTAVTRARARSCIAPVFAAVVAFSCGARTGLEPQRWQELYRDIYSDASTPFDGQTSGGGGACDWNVALEALNASDGGGGACRAGPELLECDVASNGATGFSNFCVTSIPTCSATSNPECQSQCNASEFGVVCAGSDVPVAPGCRIVWPSPPSGSEGMVFCCTCA